MNAEAMVTLAETWTTVPPRHTCTTVFHTFESLPVNLNEGQATTLTLETDACKDDKKTSVKYVEHVQLIVDIDYPTRGNLAIWITSPQGIHRFKLTLKCLRSQEPVQNYYLPVVVILQPMDSVNGLCNLFTRGENKAKEIGRLKLLIE